MEQLLDKLKEVKELLKKEMPDECTAVSIFFNADSIDMNISTRQSEIDKGESISMRNLKGDWLK